MKNKRIAIIFLALTILLPGCRNKNEDDLNDTSKSADTEMSQLSTEEYDDQYTEKVTEEKGTDAYSRCMNKAIAENEEKKKNKSSDNKLNWVIEPKIEAEDIIVGDRYIYDPSDEPFISSPYVYIKRNGKYGLINYDGTVKVEPEYDSFNGDNLYGLDEFIAVYDSKSGDTVFGQRNSTDYKGHWELVEQKKAYGAPGIGSISTTFFINENDGKLYRYHPNDIAAEAINGGADASYVVQKINYVSTDYGFGKSKAADENFYLYNEASGEGEFLTEGYKYVSSSSSGSCLYSGTVGDRAALDGYTTVAFSNNGEEWDLYDSLGELIASGLEPFDCNLNQNLWWAPATSFFDEADLYDSALNTNGKPVPFCATEGYIAAKIDGKCGYLDMDGNVVIEFGIFDDVRPVHDGKAWVKFNGKWGVISFEEM